jgi:anthranilate synthase component 2
MTNPRILVIDNYDSFVYNLVQYLGELGAEPLVYRNDDISPADVRGLRPGGIIISPGPGRPSDAGVSNSIIEEYAAEVPILGVCLGHQCIGEVFGGEVVRAPEVLHGKTSKIYHRNEGIFAGLDIPFEATRYHSLVVERSTLPPTLKVIAETDDELIMGLRHRELEVWGVQFHPESILTSGGKKIVENFLSRLEQQPSRLALV